MTSDYNNPTKGSIKGRVLYKDHIPVNGAVVMITGNSPPHNDIALLTDSDGFYRLDGLEPGLYDILISKKIYSRKKNVNVYAGKESELNYIVE